jgi:hypothetical protein
MTESYPIDSLGTPILKTIADIPATVPPPRDEKDIQTVMKPPEVKTPEQVLNETIISYTEQALKWFGLLNNPENVTKIQTHLSKLINSLKEI